jgi:hypothetical protein
MSKTEYIINKELVEHFFTDELQRSVLGLSNALNGKGDIKIFTDAMMKGNGLPNGIAVTAPYSETMLFPFLLRDPGCGFLLFKVNGVDQTQSDWTQQIGTALNDFVNHELLTGETRKKIIANLCLKDILFAGLASVTDRVENDQCFSDLKFSVDHDFVELENDEQQLLVDDLLNLTNTLEIRSTDSANKDLIGFIHSGCHIFPRILVKKFTAILANFAYEHQLFSLEQIKQGHFGVPINTTLGYQYYQWLKAAMNYALVNRYLLYREIKKFLKEQFNVELTLINDVPHAGIFSTVKNSTEYTVSTRGVQLMSPSQWHLVAGQKESIALLLTAGPRADQHDYLMQHGTSYQIAEITNDFLTTKSSDAYFEAAQNAYYNTDFNIENCSPYAFNILKTFQYHADIGLADLVSVLMPAINIHGKISMERQKYSEFNQT